MLSRILLSILFLQIMCTHVYSITVPRDECRKNWGPEIGASDCKGSHVCTRFDGPASITAAGTPTVILGEEIVCENCMGCPDSEPPTMLCVEDLQVSFTESLNVSISTEISIDVEVIKSAITSAIGAEDSRTVSLSAQCGSENFPPCKKGKYTVSMTAMKGKKAQVPHKYTWEFTPNRPSSDCRPHKDDGGSSTSTGTGNVAVGNASCVWGGYIDCNPSGTPGTGTPGTGTPGTGTPGTGTPGTGTPGTGTPGVTPTPDPSVI